MAKYDRIKEPVRKAKEFNEIAMNKEESLNSTLKMLNMQRQFSSYSDEELLQFGMDLFQNGYTLDTVKIDLELCATKREINPEDKTNVGRIEYAGIEHVPSYEKMLTVVDKPILFKAIEIGYNIAYRRNLAKKMDEKYGMSR